eukprot:tig00000391_g24837.t1
MRSGILSAVLGDGAAFTAGGRIAVRTEQAVYFAGDTITGLVYLEAKEHVSATSITLKCKGFEKCAFYTSSSHTVRDGDSSRTETREERHDGKQEFFRVKIPLASYPSQIPPGAYQWPFTFALPPSLPSSFHYQRGRDHAEVAYKLKAIVEVPGLLKPNIKSTQKVAVRQRFSNLITAQRKEIEDTVRFFCCIPRGRIKIEMWCDKSAYVPGETAQIYAKIDNKSSNDVRSVSGELIARTTLRSSSGRTETNEARPARLNSDGSDLQAGVVQKERVIPLLLPADLQPSVEGKHVKHEYLLDVEVDAGSCTCNITCQIPVVVYAPSPGPPMALAPAPGGPGTPYPAAPMPGYPPAPGAPAPGYPPAPGAPAPGYPPAPGAPGYPPAPGAPAPGYPPAPGAAPGYPPAPGAPAPGYPGYPPAPGAPAPGYPPAPGAPAPGYPPQQPAGYPPAEGAPAAPPAPYPPAPGAEPSYPAPAAAQAAPYPPPSAPAPSAPPAPPNAM